MSKGKYKLVYDFNNGFARVETVEGKWGHINIDGKELYEPKYKEVGNFRKGYVKVRTFDDRFSEVGLNGKELFDPCFDAALKKKRLGEIEPDDGHWIEKDMCFGGSLFVECKDGPWRAVDSEGRLSWGPTLYGPSGWIFIVAGSRSPVFSSRGYARAKTADGRYGHVRKEEGLLSLLYEPCFKYVRNFEGDYALAETFEKNGLVKINTKGEIQ